MPDGKWPAPINTTVCSVQAGVGIDPNDTLCNNINIFFSVVQTHGPYFLSLQYFMPMPKNRQAPPGSFINNLVIYAPTFAETKLTAGVFFVSDSPGSDEDVVWNLQATFELRSEQYIVDTTSFIRFTIPWETYLLVSDVVDITCTTSLVGGTSLRSNL